MCTSRSEESHGNSGATLNEKQSSASLGDREVVTADEIGWNRVEDIVRASTSRRVEPVKQVLDKAPSPRAVVSRKYVGHPWTPGAIVARTDAMTAWGYTKGGDAVAATYMANSRAALSMQADSIRFASNTICLMKGETTPIFGVVGAWHVPGALAFRRANFVDVKETKVAVSVVMAARDWGRGKDWVFMMLPSMAAAKAAAELRDRVKEIEEIEHALLLGKARGQDPDPRLLRKYQEFKIGFGAYWFWAGFECKVAIEREPLRALQADTGGFPLGITK